MYFVDSKKRELFFLPLSLLHVPCATSFENLRTFQNIAYATFFEAAVARYLVKVDDEWERCFEEAFLNQFSNALCNLFTFIWAICKLIASFRHVLVTILKLSFQTFFSCVFYP